MGIVDSNGLPISISIASASPHETKLVHQAINHCYTTDLPGILIGDKAYDSDRLDQDIRDTRGIEIIAPHRINRKKKPTQDGRSLRRYRRRWKVERLFAWLHNFRRTVTRWEYYEENFLGFIQLACIVILLRRF